MMPHLSPLILMLKNEGLNQIINFRTHVGDEAIAREDNPIRVLRDEGTGEPSPYILIRTNLEALIDRKSFYRLMWSWALSKTWKGLIGLEYAQVEYFFQSFQKLN